MNAYFTDGIVHKDGFVEITVDSLDRQRPARVVDVRELEEFNDELGHMAGAENVPLATLHVAAELWDPSEPLIVVCRSGKRSSVGASLLHHKGFAIVANLQGGMMAYRASLGGSNA